MPCSTHVLLYYDLEGKPTGEYSIECAGECEFGRCEQRVHKSPDGASTRIYCACLDADGKEVSRETCSMELLIEKVAGGRVELTPLCCPKPCGICQECRVVSYSRAVTILDLDSDRPRVRQVEQFRCECRYVQTDALRRFYQDKICKLVAFAANHGIELSKTDLFHAHVITETNPKCRDASGNLILDEQFMMENYRGLLAHAHEYDNGRSETEDNFNIVVEANGEVHFVGSTTPVDANDHRIPQGPWPGSIYFRLCDPGKDCPDCTTKIHCAAIDKDLCVGLRRRWPANDPALGL